MRLLPGSAQTQRQTIGYPTRTPGVQTALAGGFHEMAFDEKLAGRIRKHLAKGRGIAEKQMFGGVAFLLNGNLCCGVHRDEMIVRVAPADNDRALRQPHTRQFDMTGRPMKGWIQVRPAGLKTGAALAKWIEAGRKHPASLPLAPRPR
jgi:TfoX/Sxy family transcriptional regulator of competence genes